MKQNIMKVGNRMKNGNREDRMQARFAKLVAENTRLKRVLQNAGIDEWFVPDPILQSKFDNIIANAKIKQGI